MAGHVLKLEERRDRGQAIARAVLMYKVDASRHETALTLAKMLHEARQDAAAVEWSDIDGGPLFPYVSVGRGTIEERWRLGRDADDRMWHLGLSPRGNRPPRAWDLGWILGGVALFVRRRGTPIRKEAASVDWVVAVATECAVHGWNARQDVLGAAAAEIEGRAHDVGEAEAAYLLEFAWSLRTRDVGRSGRVLLEYGKHLQSDGRLDEAYHILRVAYEAALHQLDSRIGAVVGQTAGRVLRRLGRWEEAFHWYTLAAELARFDDDLVTLAHALNGLATAHADRGATPKAREYSAQALGIALASHDQEVLGAVYRGAAMIARISGRLADGAFLAWRSAMVSDDAVLHAHSLVQLGSILVDSGLLQHAEQAYRLGLAGLEIGSSAWVSTTDALAFVAALRGDAAIYDLHYRTVEPLLEGTEPRDRVQLLFSRARALALLGRARASRKAHEATIAYARANGFLQYSERSELELEATPDPPVADERTEQIGEWLTEAVAQLPGSGL